MLSHASGQKLAVLLCRQSFQNRALLLFWKLIFTAKAILFDMDGVLVDSTAAVARVWRGWAIENGLDPERVIAHAHGRRSIETVLALAPHLDAERENIRIEQMEIDDKDGVIALPGAVELLRSLPMERFAIVTSATRPLAEARMGYAGLPIPKGRFVGGDDVLHGKPSPEPYLKGAALLGFTPEECLVFEDAPAGISAARAAGMRVIALHTTCAAHELNAAEVILASLAEVQAQFHDGVITLHTNVVSA
jgi:sugar-phosphatase